MLKQYLVKRELERIVEQLGEMEPDSEEYKKLVARFAELVKAQLDLVKIEDVIVEDDDEEESVIWRILQNGPLVAALGSIAVAGLVIVAEVFGDAILNSKALRFS